MQSRLRPIFEQLSKVNDFSSPSASELNFRYYEAVLNAAIAKCIDFNVLINSGEIEEKNSFLYLANLRGIAEDLIVVEFLKSLGAESRVEYLKNLQNYNFSTAFLSQVEFFKSNNPFQPVVGGNSEELRENRSERRRTLRNFWKDLGEAKKDGPSVRDMAEWTGLIHTYEYIYFLSSNFVHFNPLTLMRMGWGPDEGPFKFSLHNFCRYYADAASFYGSILVLAFYYRAGREMFSSKSEEVILDLLRAVDQVPRWPEIVTYEELNRRPPIQHFLSQAMRKVAEESGEDIPYGAILKEVRGPALGQ